MSRRNSADATACVTSHRAGGHPRTAPPPPPPCMPVHEIQAPPRTGRLQPLSTALEGMRCKPITSTCLLPPKKETRLRPEELDHRAWALALSLPSLPSLPPARRARSAACMLCLLGSRLHSALPDRGQHLLLLLDADTLLLGACTVATT